MATVPVIQPSRRTSEFAKPVFALKLNRACVKIHFGYGVTTGTIVGVKNNKTLILTVAHSIGEARRWMNNKQIESQLSIQFFESELRHPCTMVFLEEMSDIMMLLVDRATPEDHKLKLASGREWILVESQLLGSRGHPMGNHEWVFVDGYVCTPRLENKGSHRIMDSYYQDLVFFQHRLDMGKGYSGAALVNLNGNIVGMHTGISADDYNVLASDKMVEAVEAKEKQLLDEFNALKEVEKDLTVLEQKREKADIDIKNAMVSSADWEYGRQDARSMTVLRSQLRYAIHVEYIQKRIQGDTNRSLEDIYIRDPPPASSSSPSAAY